MSRILKADETVLEIARRTAADNRKTDLVAVARPAARPRTPPRDLEHPIQRGIFEWIDGEGAARWPALRFTFAVPNFAGRLGKATARHGARLKAEGRRPGAPDVVVPITRGQRTVGAAVGLGLLYAYRWPGLYLEVKSEEGRLSPEQQEFKLHLQSQGYAWAMPRSAEEGIDLITRYMEERWTFL